MSRVSHTCKWVVCIHLVIDWHSSSDLLTFIQWSIVILRKWMRQDTKCARCLIHFRNEADTKCVFRENEADSQCARSNNVSTFRVCFIFENERVLFIKCNIYKYVCIHLVIYWHSSKMNETSCTLGVCFVFSENTFRVCFISKMNETSCTFRVLSHSFSIYVNRSLDECQ